jgi:methylmalonyl-CoA mutase
MAEADVTVDITKIDTDRGFFDEFPFPDYGEWKEEVVKALKGAPFEKVMFTSTYEGLTINPIYSADDIKELPHLDSRPGFVPFVRGTRVGGYLKKAWDICQELTVPLPEDFNDEARFDRERGQTMLNLVLDRPTREGFDPAEADQVGERGLSLATVADVRHAFKGLEAEQTPLLSYTGAVSLPLLALLASGLKAEGCNLERITGCVGSDPLTELARWGTLRMDLNSAYDLMFLGTAWAKEAMPELQTIFIQGHPYHDAGASSTEEVAFALATAAEYIREMLNRGLAVNDITPRMRFGFSLGSNFFMEIAKLRAARILWSQIAAAFGANEQAQKMSIHGRTSAYNKTTYDPYVNMLRITSEGFSGAVGGVDSMHLAPFDEPIRTPDRFSRRIARNAQIILQEEARFTMPIDMGGGSYYIEKMTDQFARTAWGIFQEIEGMGGMARAIADGYPQKRAADTAAKRWQRIASRQDVILGTNMYANLLEKPIEIPEIDGEAIRQKRVATVADYRMKHASTSLPEILAELSRRLEKGSPSCMETAMEAVNNGATLGDLSSLLPRPVAKLPTAQALRIHRASEPFEELRRVSECHLTETGKRMTIFLANMGPIPQHKPRADFACGFFEVAGFEMLHNEGFAGVDEAAEAALVSGAMVTVICSTDATYPEYVPTLATNIKAAKPEMTVIVAGKQPAEVEQQFRAAGVDDFIHVRANCYEMNRNLQCRYREVTQA